MIEKNVDTLNAEEDIMFSIVIPNYNSKQWWKRLVKSIEDQTYKNYEVIIIDDFSTDGSLEEIREYIHDTKDEPGNWNVWLNETKRLNGGTRNVGVSMAKGKYIMFMDCDDFFYSNNCLQLIADEIEKTHADLIRLPYHFISKHGERDMILHENTIEELMKTIFVAPWTKCIKRELFKPFPEGTLLEDVSQHIEQIDNIETIGYVNQPIIVWNCLNDNQVSKHDENPIRRASYWRVIGDLEQLDLKHDYSKEWQKARLEQYYKIARERLQ